MAAAPPAPAPARGTADGGRGGELCALGLSPAVSESRATSSALLLTAGLGSCELRAAGALRPGGGGPPHAPWEIGVDKRLLRAWLPATDGPTHHESRREAMQMRPFAEEQQSLPTTTKWVCGPGPLAAGRPATQEGPRRQRLRIDQRKVRRHRKSR
jgi:hypothetical protein